MPEKACLITGASRGIGAAAARKLARREYFVFINFRHSQAEAAAVVQSIHQEGGAADAIAADVADRAAVDSMLQQVAQRFNRLDLLIHNAALPLKPAPLLRLDWSRDVLPQLEVSAQGFLNVVQASAPLIFSGSRIVVLLTDALFHTPPVQMGAYLAAKGALWGLVRAASKELRQRGVIVNSLSPSMVDTELLHGYPDRAREIMAQDHVLGRLAGPDEVAAVIEALATDPSSYMHGANIIVNGGAEF